MSHGSEKNPADAKQPLSVGELRAPMHRDEAIWKLEVMSRRGRLPGFRKTLTGCGVAAHGKPFDMVMYLDGVEREGGQAAFTTRLLLERRVPAIAAVIFVLTVFPGVLLTDSFMRLHLDFYGRWTNDGLQTWWWYIPLSVVSLVWAWFSAIAKSKKSGAESGEQALAKIAAELGGTVVTDGAEAGGSGSAAAGPEAAA